MQLGSFTANIIVDGKGLEEYDTVSESPTQVTCWVPSEEGKSFGVQWKCHEESRVAATQGLVYVDGLACGRAWNFPGMLGVDDTSTLAHHYDTTAMRDLMFTRVQLSDDDSLLNKETTKNLGEISLVIERGTMVKEPCPASNQNRVVPSNNETLHERSKKATVHCVGFGPERARTVTPYIWRLIRNSQPRLTFVFKYRPLGVLQANGIAPKPTPTGTNTGSQNVSIERDLGISDDTIEDIKPAQLNERIQSLENELKRLRDLQASNSEDRKPKRIKTEEPRDRRPVLPAVEIIDLT